MLSDLTSNKTKQDNRSRILIIDDDPSILTTFRIALETFGHDAIGASNPSEILAEAIADPFAAIVIDQFMPSLTGSQFVRQLRGAGITTPVLLMSASAISAEESAAVEFQDVVFEPKPILPSRFRELVSGLLTDSTNDPNDRM